MASPTGYAMNSDNFSFSDFQLSAFAATGGKVAVVCINGILTAPGDAEGWTDRAVTWLNCRFPGVPVKSEKFEYATGPLVRHLRQGQRARAVAKMAGFYHRAGFAVVLVGHSNGCDIIARTLALVDFPVASVHLFAPAADGVDFLPPLRSGQLQGLHLYGSTSDWALKAAVVSRKLVGWLGLGFGSLGLRCRDFAINCWWAGHPVWDHSDNSQGHGTWWARGDRFELTMGALARDIFNEPQTNPDRK